MPVVRDIRQQAEKDDYRFSAIVKGIVNSTPFRMKQVAGKEVEVTTVD
jgi:hypothetical protein